MCVSLCVYFLAFLCVSLIVYVMNEILPAPNIFWSEWLIDWFEHCSVYSEGCLACITAYLVYLCTETHYEKVNQINPRLISIAPECIDFNVFVCVLYIFFHVFLFCLSCLSLYFLVIFFFFLFFQFSVSAKYPSILPNRMNEFTTRKAYKLLTQRIVDYA